MASCAASGSASAVVCAGRRVSSRASELGSSADLSAVVAGTAFDVAATRTPVDAYSCGTFADRLFIEHQAHLPGREKSLEAIHSLLSSVAAEDSWVME